MTFSGQSDRSLSIPRSSREFIQLGRPFALKSGQLPLISIAGRQLPLKTNEPVPVAKHFTAVKLLFLDLFWPPLQLRRLRKT
jgi:hypothetical protein